MDDWAYLNDINQYVKEYFEASIHGQSYTALSPNMQMIIVVITLLSANIYSVERLSELYLMSCHDADVNLRYLKILLNYGHIQRQNATDGPQEFMGSISGVQSATGFNWQGS